MGLTERKNFDPLLKVKEKIIYLFSVFTTSGSISLKTIKRGKHNKYQICYVVSQQPNEVVDSKNEISGLIILLAVNG